ncbi:MBL fold metallo-hydrolase [Fusibacter ferrireducens]|uniref:MBL fold metallo-hydrolase n=1 Tax=Fusibacter ferrireducens TaxID=2785058 RepID=A0ABR9ZN47_9FIRM|nr:MBL fold metallo-hydrolase [Fusibacter ferrireducens]MBF4691839.1 MBL fold metallo-hydrolase [Fusibacter ferrireducens]
MEFLTLMDNIVYGEVLTAEHGLSFLIKAGGKKILFDTGQTGAILHNASYLNEELETVDLVVLSHGHYDHCGGLESFLKVNHTAKIYLKSKAMEKKYRRDYSSVGFELQKPLSEYPNEFIFIEDNVEIAPGILLVGHINKYVETFDSMDSFFVKEDQNYIMDPFQDELFMIISEKDKHYLFTGCSHKGILNIIKSSLELLEDAPLEFVAGGMHFNGKIVNVLDQYIEQFERLNVKHFYVNHCTGIEGYMKFKNRLNTDVTYAFTGFRYEE